MKQLLSRLRSLLPGHPPAEVDEELSFHIEKQTQANIVAGMIPEEAHRQAMIAFGGVESTREACREQRPLSFLETLFYDVRY